MCISTVALYFISTWFKNALSVSLRRRSTGCQHMTRVRRRHVCHARPPHVQQATQRPAQRFMRIDGQARGGVRLLAAARPQRAAAVLRGGRGGTHAAQRRGVAQQCRGRGRARGERAAAAAATWPLHLQRPCRAAAAAAAAHCAAQALQWR